MSRLSSVAVSAAAFIAIVTTVAVTVPGKALGLDRVPALAAATTVSATVPDINASTPMPVPGLGSTTDITPDEVHVASPSVTAGTDASANTDMDSVIAPFASLAAAVDANDQPGAGDPELGCLAGAIYFESKGEPLRGQLAVANVILNRAESGRFPDSICDVVLQPGQFSFVRGGHIPHVRHDSEYRTALGVARVAMDGDWKNPAPKAMFFHARRVSPRWGKARVAMIGNHIFYR